MQCPPSNPKSATTTLPPSTTPTSAATSTNWRTSKDDPAASIAQARVRAGVTTRWHRLTGITERYVILSGLGRVEIGDVPPQHVGCGDVVMIPAGCRQRIACLGESDLIFLAICTPRFQPEAYVDIDPDPQP